MSYPFAIKHRIQIDALTGIKSSLSNIRQVIALTYILFVVNKRRAIVEYCDSINETTLSIKPELLNGIKQYLQRDDIELIVNNNPLLKNQYEPLYVGMSLLFRLACLKMNGKQNTAERTGGLRYPKQIYFASNIVLLDLILKGFPEETLRASLYEWLNNRPSSNQDFENKVCSYLSVCSLYTQFKVRDENANEIFFQTEGVYKALANGQTDVTVDDSKENVGPTRIYKSVIRENLEPWIKQTGNYLAFANHSIINPEEFLQIISTTLDISSVKDESVAIHDFYEGKEEKYKELPKQLSNFHQQLLTALRTKPFALLAGISGTGKSRIVRELAKACWPADSEERTAHKPSNFEMVQVRPNWHDSSDLLGYVSRISGKPEFVAGDFLKFIVRAWENLENPHFLCLDEMNLAPVEQYFAEYLSVVETRKLENGIVVTDPIMKKEAEEWYHTLVCSLTADDSLKQQFLTQGISIPQNLFVVGTVNMDETTFSFSRKVLDRAMTIEMNDVDLKGGLEADTTNEFGEIGNSIIPQTVEGKDVYADNKELCDKVLEYLGSVNGVLDKTPFKIAYRTRNEFLVYAVTRGEENLIAALDEMTSMKILSRIEGDSDRTANPLEALKKIVEEKIVAFLPQDGRSISAGKVAEMQGKLKSGYTSFWS